MNETPPSPMRTPTLNLIGAGRVGQTLAQLWHRQGSFSLQGVYTRDPAHARAAVDLIGAGQAAASLADMPEAQVWLFAVPDTQITIAAQAVADATRAVHARRASFSSTTADTTAATTLAITVPITAPIALHCSGFLPADALAPLHALGWSLASAHPALSFADAATAQAQFAGSLCALEGNATARAEAERAFTAIGGRCFTLAAADKPLYHGAAVFASNFLPVLQATATELWQGSGVPADLVSALAANFLRKAADNVLQLGPAAALTGPAARGDDAVVERQGRAMAQRDATLGEAYRSLSELAARLAREGRVLPP